MSAADEAKWRSRMQPLPTQRTGIPFTCAFSPVEWNCIRAGLLPRRMEDKWCVLADGADTVRFCRSWTGFCLFELQGAPDAGGGVAVRSAWASRDPQQWSGTHAGYDAALLGFLIDALLLRKAGSFPLPPGEQASPVVGAGLLQHHLAGTGYPEVEWRQTTSSPTA